ncbi:Endonuclease/exonuclease/phosphatase [Parachaetomium inaequale]|uniref:Endonuclease/exonuclease/phosphatase n=1 Tax=Parachaetomium inaequale TaxID=2588326 RepID=A0AAN6P9Q3_9PEZI|nr:Endonuclease/exonuclease/phosphatase [Parachaetomium inaequale]
MHRDISPPPVKRRKLGGPVARPRTIRVFSWNINGIAPFLPPQSTKITSFFKPSEPDRPSKPPKADGLRAFLSRHNWPEALFLQELKIQPGNASAVAALLSSLNTPLHPGDDTLSESRTYTLDAVLPRDKHNARGFQGKLYGVATILRADFASRHGARVRGVDWDLEGRVSVVELDPEPRAAPFQNNNNPECRTIYKPLALLNIYAVNGTPAPYRSPLDGRVTGTRHDHKLAFHTRLRDECLELEARGFDVVVAGDLNVARGPLDGYPNLRTFPRQHCVNRADFNGKFFGVGDNKRAGAYVGGQYGQDGGGEGGCFDGVDVFRAMYGDERRYTYYPRTREWGSSCDRVDMVVVSRGLWEAGRVRGTGILDTPQERGRSDHVPLWVEIVVGGGEREETG